MIEPVPRRVALVVNAKSRKGRRLFRKACRLLKAADFEVSNAHAVRQPAPLSAAVRGAIASDAPMVIVGGGDGSLSTAVDHFVGHDTIFAVLPLGTANSFARTLGIPLDLEGAIKALATGHVRRIDLGMIDRDYFANCASIGIAPQIAETMPHGLKAWLGRPGYLLWAARQSLRFHPFQLTIGEGTTAETLEAVEVRIANGPYYGGVELVDQARLDSGRIVVQAVTGQTRRQLFWNWFASWTGLSARNRMTREFEGTSIRIATDPPLPISIDGEVLARTPVTARIARGVIRVAAPASHRQIKPERGLASSAS